MYSEFDQFSILGMANSELFIVKEDRKEEIELFSILSAPPPPPPPNRLEYNNNNTPATDQHREGRGIVVQIRDDHKYDDQEDDIEKVDKYNEEELKRPASLLVGKSEVITVKNYWSDDDDDGFKTPTSLDHKIPEPTRCPLAPRKMRPPKPSAKRKVLSPKQRLGDDLPHDLSEEVESFFSSTAIVQDDIKNMDRRIKKKARTSGGTETDP